MIESHKDLDVWKLEMELAEDCYRLSREFPSDERFGLTSQMGRAAVSIPANIAEGNGRNQTGNYIQFLKISMGSASELETLLLLSERLGYFDTSLGPACATKVVRISKMLHSLIRVLESRK